MNTLTELQAVTGQELNGLNAPPGFREAAGGDNTFASTSDLIDAGLVMLGINEDFQGAGSDMGAFEFALSLVLYGALGDRTIYLSWEVNVTLPPGTTWMIDYTGPSGRRRRVYALTGSTNYEWNTVTLSSDPAGLMDTARWCRAAGSCIPAVMRGSGD